MTGAPPSCSRPGWRVTDQSTRSLSKLCRTRPTGAACRKRVSSVAATASCKVTARSPSAISSSILLTEMCRG